MNFKILAFLGTIFEKFWHFMTITQYTNPNLTYCFPPSVQDENGISVYHVCKNAAHLIQNHWIKNVGTSWHSYDCFKNRFKIWYSLSIFVWKNVSTKQEFSALYSDIWSVRDVGIANFTKAFSCFLWFIAFREKC